MSVGSWLHDSCTCCQVCRNMFCNTKRYIGLLAMQVGGCMHWHSMDGYWCTSLLPTSYLINLVRLIRYLITVNLNWQYYCTYLDFASAVLPPLPRSKHVSLSKYYLENMKFRCCNCSAVLGLSTSIIWARELDIDELNCKGAVSKCVSVYLASYS